MAHRIPPFKTAAPWHGIARPEFGSLESALCAELAEYCAAHGLRSASADEIAADEETPEECRAWLLAFGDRWDGAMRYTPAGTELQTHGEVFAFTHGGTLIEWPLVSECGRFPCDPGAYGFRVETMGGNCTAWARDFTLNGAPVRMLYGSAQDSTHDIGTGAAGLGVQVYDPAGPWFTSWIVRETADGYAVSDIEDDGYPRPFDSAALARAFSAIVRETFTPEELAEINRRNATPEYAGACATHDYSDSNMLIFAAWCELAGLDEDTADVPAMLESADDAARWNAAWDAARAAGFTL